MMRALPGKDWSQADLAERVGVSRNSINGGRTDQGMGDQCDRHVKACSADLAMAARHRSACATGVIGSKEAENSRLPNAIRSSRKAGSRSILRENEPASFLQPISLPLRGIHTSRSATLRVADPQENEGNSQSNTNQKPARMRLRCPMQGACQLSCSEELHLAPLSPPGSGTPAISPYTRGPAGHRPQDPDHDRSQPPRYHPRRHRPGCRDRKSTRLNSS